MPDILQQVGEALYDARWQSEIARRLGVTDRSVRRWVAGETEPDDLTPKLRKMVDCRIAKLVKVHEKLAAKGSGL
jgi:predicted transcriptional regulator